MECLLGFLLMNFFFCVNDYFNHLNINFMFMFGGCNHVLEVFLLFLLFGFGLKVFKFTLYLKGFEFDRYLSDFGDKTGVFQNGVCSKDDLEFICCSNISSGKCRLERDVQNLDKFHSSKCNLDDDCTATAVLKGDSDDDDDLEFKCCSKISAGKCRLERDVQILDKFHSSKCNLDHDSKVNAVLKGDYDDDDDLEFKCCSKISSGKFKQNLNKIHSSKCNLDDDSKVNAVLKCDSDDLEFKCCLKISSGKFKPERDVQNLDKINSSKCNLDDDCTVNAAVLKGDFDDDDDNAEKCYDYDVDDAFDVLALRKLVKIERHRAKSVYLELEKERMASSTAAEEAMAMILRLQNEKSLVEMEAKQYKRLAEEKQLHDQDVIRSLQWLVLKHESERSNLEDQLSLCLQKARVQSNEEEKQGSFFEEYVCSSENSMENGLDPRFFSSLDMDLSME